jgi:hypothetical protein
VKQLHAAHTGAGLEYFVLMYNPRTKDVDTYTSKGTMALRERGSSIIQLFQAAILQSEAEQQLVLDLAVANKQLRSNIKDISESVLRMVVVLTIEDVIHDRKGVAPYKQVPARQVLLKVAPWWPLPPADDPEEAEGLTQPQLTAAAAEQPAEPAAAAEQPARPAAAAEQPARPAAAAEQPARPAAAAEQPARLAAAAEQPARQIGLQAVTEHTEPSDRVDIVQGTRTQQQGQQEQQGQPAAGMPAAGHAQAATSVQHVAAVEYQHPDHMTRAQLMAVLTAAVRHLDYSRCTKLVAVIRSDRKTKHFRDEWEQAEAAAALEAHIRHVKGDLTVPEIH